MSSQRLSMDELDRLAALAASAPRPLAVLEAVGVLIMRHLDAGGFTMFRYVPATAEVERLHSSGPIAYPVGGRKRVVDYPNNQSVLARGEVYIAHGRNDVRDTYKDYEKIFGLGVTSIMNVPVRFCGRNVGALNVFGVEGQFGEAEADIGRQLAAAMLPALLGWPADKEQMT